MKISVGEAWLSEVAKSKETRDNYERGINSFLGYCGCNLEDLEEKQK